MNDDDNGRLTCFHSKPTEGATATALMRAKRCAYGEAAVQNMKLSSDAIAASPEWLGLVTPYKMVTITYFAKNNCLHISCPESATWLIWEISK